MYVLLIGNLTVGYHAVGTFSSYDAAHTYARRHVAEGLWYIFTLHQPEAPRGS